VTVLVHGARASVKVGGKTLVEWARAITPGPIGEPWLAVGLSASVDTSVSNWMRLVMK